MQLWEEHVLVVFFWPQGFLNKFVLGGAYILQQFDHHTHQINTHKNVFQIKPPKKPHLALDFGCNNTPPPLR